MLSLPIILTRLSADEALFSKLTFSTLSQFLDIMVRYIPHLVTTAPRRQHGVPSLPLNLRDVLASTLALSYEEIDKLWAATGELLLNQFNQTEASTVHPSVDELLAKNGPPFGLGVEVMIAPIRSCVCEGCPQQGRPLGGDRKVYTGTLFSHGRGVLPIQIVTLYCRGCKTTYRPNYSVAHAESTSSVREYYAGVPKFLEVTQHSYVEQDLITLFRHQMAFSHASGDGCAKIYNLSLRAVRHGSSAMTSEIVWNAFYIHALLLHHSRQDTALKLPHHGEQSDRIAAALQSRNDQMVGVGQTEWAHACDDCEKIVKLDDADADGPAWGRLNACVMDGVCIGHPRCHVYHCTERLESPRHRYCTSHSALASICAIGGCQSPCTDGKRTCGIPAHREVEEERRRKGQAMFELKRRLQARDVASTIRAVASVDESLSLLDDPDLDDPTFLDDPALTSNVERKKPHARKPKLKTTLTRRWTHNEQLLVRPCGIVISRATFYEAESLPNSRLFLNATFPKHFPHSRPSFLFFDNNCKLLAHLVNVQDDFLLHMGFPVDVFHAVKKHQRSHAYCQDHCNPAGFPELIGEKPGEWVFNSSACEQVNVWFAKFLPVVREMSEVHFNFFLDEMIAIHNEVRVSELAAKRRRPRLVPLEELGSPAM